MSDPKIVRHLFSIGSHIPQNTYPGGSRNDVTVSELPILEGMSLSLLKLNKNGVREPHWHPNANELGYCVAGKGIMTIFGSGSTHNTLNIEPGTLTFVPMGSFHHIENAGEETLEMLICFNHEKPEDLNLSSLR